MKTPNEQVADKIELTKVHGYAAVGYNDNGGQVIAGYFKDSIVANAKTIGIGGWGSNGKTEPVVLHEDAQGHLYEIRHIGPFSDVLEVTHKAIIENIKKKLSPVELEYLLSERQKEFYLKEQ